ncbi:MAG TPA: type II toxin-antitoxin system VapC family toxin [Bryobacteraceae bacterium]|nr:type II toxin-antitoxin system VapC family toxin [Bryobacteraceae bacterium]
MPVLLDTHTFLWWCEDSPELSHSARQTIERQDCFVSLASFWEIAIKVNLGKLHLPSSIERFLPEQMSLNGFETLEIGFRAVARCASLPNHHRDPFDRLLIAQAQEADLPIVSRDTRVDPYGVKRIW